MKKAIGIITGASGGIGKEFVALLTKEEIDQVWVITRNEDKLKQLKKAYGSKVIPMVLDLTKPEAMDQIKDRLLQEEVVVTYLINNAGLAKMGRYNDFSVDEIQKTIMLNCTVPVCLTTTCIPFMVRGSKILNISSASSFQPLPYLNLYASTKVFERHYSRALNRELKSLGITSTAVCPSWVDTDMLTKEVNGKKIKFQGMVSPDLVAKTAIRDAKKGKDMSECTFFIKYIHFLAKVFPQKMSMNTWMRKINKYK